MSTRWWWMLAAAGCVLLAPASSRDKSARPVTVPVVLDHNRMLVDGEIQRKDGSWRKARFWVDTGNPDFMMSEECARDLGIESSGKTARDNGENAPPANIRFGGIPLDVGGIAPIVRPGRYWGVTHSDANLPSTVLKRYQVVFDYPRRLLTIAPPGSLPHSGLRVPASVKPETGIVQLDAGIDGERFSFALDNGASYSFASRELIDRLSAHHSNWPRVNGALGCANMWGWWPEEASWPVVRVPEIYWGAVRLAEVGIAGLPDMFGGLGLGAWYSQKSARPVAGFLGPNAFKAFRVEIDYADSAVYFDKGAEFDGHDMDLVGVTLSPEPDGSYRVIGIASKSGKPAVEGVEAGDKLFQAGDLQVKGSTMGAVVDALRGKPGEIRNLILERNGVQFRVTARVQRLL